MSGHIVVVEDEEAIRTMLAEVLADEGYTVDAAATIEEGFAAVRRRPPQLLICDLMLPPSTGRVLYDWLARYPEYAPIPFVFLTALPPILADERLIGDLVHVPVLYKPLLIHELLAVVEMFIQPADAAPDVG